jgi:hypothetical protein
MFVLSSDLVLRILLESFAADQPGVIRGSQMDVAIVADADAATTASGKIDANL